MYILKKSFYITPTGSKIVKMIFPYMAGRFINHWIGICKLFFFGRIIGSRCGVDLCVAYAAFSAPCSAITTTPGDPRWGRTEMSARKIRWVNPCGKLAVKLPEVPAFMYKSILRPETIWNSLAHFIHLHINGHINAIQRTPRLKSSSQHVHLSGTDNDLY